MGKWKGYNTFSVGSRFTDDLWFVPRFLGPGYWRSLRLFCTRGGIRRALFVHPGGGAVPLLRCFQISTADASPSSCLLSALDLFPSTDRTRGRIRGSDSRSMSGLTAGILDSPGLAARRLGSLPYLVYRVGGRQFRESGAAHLPEPLPLKRNLSRKRAERTTATALSSSSPDE